MAQWDRTRGHVKEKLMKRIESVASASPSAVLAEALSFKSFSKALAKALPRHALPTLPAIEGMLVVLPPHTFVMIVIMIMVVIMVMVMIGTMHQFVVCNEAAAIVVVGLGVISGAIFFP
eukprot:CAMPEP_0195014834 /NCGR_PEP_ID=MMETSP0326_2-20130528/16672_1 /TAXON_ID=2866 ORGANISM="Crypthecodinium cohnii, Strain Seligo" /NCGR_SAMPLE_ID=MMETSP0326_2 /ASSEMBLY_ACC=CAM_ASM_000348 /LENGTH=118 /DNA_ID=CAMNT_0040028303 /DNA_START=70 /DNA_END=424 /DNA_ORIENTATION=-